MSDELLKELLGEYSLEGCIFTCGPKGFMLSAKKYALIYLIIFLLDTFLHKMFGYQRYVSLCCRYIQKLGWASYQIFEFDS